MSHVAKVIFRSGFVFRKIVPVKCHKRNFISNKVFNAEYKTMQQIRNKLVQTLQTDYQFTTEPKPREHLLKFLPSSQDEIPVRKMKDSFDTAVIPLSSDLDLRDKYTTFLGLVRFGRLMEDMDLFAGYISYKHIYFPNVPSDMSTPVVVVTISVSHIEILQQAQSTADIRISGHVCWVGKSSLEVAVWLEQELNGKWQQITRALMLMAARNSTNSGAGIVNRIEAETPDEQELLNGGEERKLRRHQKMKESLLKTVPTEEELHIIHKLFTDTIDSRELFLDRRILPPNSKWMQDATLNNLVFCHPEHRNLHNKIFGGFLIRQALELSWGAAYLHGMKVPKLIHISDIGFYSPVDVGSLLKLFASVTYTEDDYIEVFVYADAFNTFNPQGKSTTGFHFTYKLGKPIDKVYPSTYLEAMKYIDGRRHYIDVMNFSPPGKSRS